MAICEMVAEMGAIRSGSSNGWLDVASASFVGFIPFEEHQLPTARGDDYRGYMAQTPYRLFRGVW